MAETAFGEFIIPGTFIRVRSEGLIGAGGVSTGNIGVVGTARQGIGETETLSDYATGQTKFGASDDKAKLTRTLAALFNNGARTVYARGLPLGQNDAAPGRDDYLAAFRKLILDEINILVAPELSTADALTVFGTITEEGENGVRDMIAVVGADGADIAAIKAQAPSNDRIVLTTPGIGEGDDGRLGAAAVAGLLSTLSPEASPTNKTLPGVATLPKRYAYGEIKDLVQNRILVLEQRRGVRVVRGVTTDDGAFKQITTRRIVDYAKAGIRQAANPFIGKLNNERVRKALYGAVDGFLTRMLQDEQLTAYTLEVTASRPDEIAGIARVNALLKPTFSIDYIAVTLVLQ